MTIIPFSAKKKIHEDVSNHKKHRDDVPSAFSLMFFLFVSYLGQSAAQRHGYKNSRMSEESMLS